MKKLLIILALSIAFLITGTQAWATSWTIDDNYIGGTASGSYVSPDGDVIGPAEFYGISGMDVHLAGDRLTIDIFTNYNYDGRPDYDVLTDFGDLFISTTGWTPYGPADYALDDAGNGTSWDYAFDVSSGKLFKISGVPGAIIISDTIMGSKTDDWYRVGQEVLVDEDVMNALGPDYLMSEYGTAIYIPGIYSMSFDVSALSLGLSEEIAFHWTMTCANDVIEGAITPVPEPGSMLLLGAGLLGLAGFIRRKKV